ncbi:hypothetical protein HDV05_003781 [Chytridiales sp. JEL 0842]|nr:hypothetical protein HDV05_003781 [Chytridiales sp. JEL 0842]
MTFTPSPLQGYRSKSRWSVISKSAVSDFSESLSRLSKLEISPRRRAHNHAGSISGSFINGTSSATLSDAGPGLSSTDSNSFKTNEIHEDAHSLIERHDEDMMLFGSVPMTLAYAIFQYLDAPTLIRHCLCDNVHLDPGVNMDYLVEKCNGDGTKLWQEAWKDAMRLQRNWKKGQYRIHDVCVADLRDSITCLRFDSDKMVVGTRRHKLSLFTAPSYAAPNEPSNPPPPPLQFSPEHEFPILCVDFCATASSLSNIIVTGDASGTLMVWNAFTGKRMAVLPNAHQGGITCVLVTEGKKGIEGRGAVIFSAGFDKMIRIHELSQISEDDQKMKNSQRRRGSAGSAGSDEKLMRLKKLLVETKRRTKVLERTFSVESDLFDKIADQQASSETLNELERPMPPILPRSTLSHLSNQTVRPPGFLSEGSQHPLRRATRLIRRQSAVLAPKDDDVQSPPSDTNGSNDSNKNGNLVDILPKRYNSDQASDDSKKLLSTTEFLEKVPDIIKNRTWPMSGKKLQAKLKSWSAAHLVKDSKDSSSSNQLLKTAAIFSSQLNKWKNNIADSSATKSNEDVTTDSCRTSLSSSTSSQTHQQYMRHLDRQAIRQELLAQLERLKKVQRRLLNKSKTRTTKPADCISTTSNNIPNPAPTLQATTYSITPLSTWSGHTGDVYFLTMTSDGDKVISGSLDHTVKVWDRETGEVEHTFMGHTDTVTCVKCVRGYIFSGSLDKTIRQWDLKEGRAVRVLLGNSGWVKTIDISGDWLISGGWDETISVWDISSGELKHRFFLERGPIVALQANERSIVVACKGDCVANRITVLDFGSGLISGGVKPHAIETNPSDTERISHEAAASDLALNKPSVPLTQESSEPEEIINAYPAVPVVAPTLKSRSPTIMFATPNTGTLTLEEIERLEDEQDALISQEIEEVLATCIDGELTEYLACTEGRTSDFDEDEDNDEDLFSDEEVWEDASGLEVIETIVASNYSNN